MSTEEFDDERDDGVQPRRVVESRHQEARMSVFTKVLVVFGIVAIIGIGLLGWILASTLRPIVQQASEALGTLGPFWMALLTLAAISLLLGLMRKVGAVKFFEDLIVLGLKVHEHFFIKSKRLHADKLGNFPIPLDPDGNPVWVMPGNAAHPMQMMPPMASGSISKRAAGRTNNSAATQIEMEQLGGQGQFQQQQGLLPSGTPAYLLNGPSAPHSPTQQVQEASYSAQTTKLDHLQLWESEWGGAPNEGRTYTKKELPGTYNFLEELGLFQPKPKSIFMARSAGGPVTGEFPKHGHIVFAGPTRVGKSTILRMLFAQYLAINIQCYLCDSHYIPYNPENGLDWTPIEARLAHPPFRKARAAADFLRWLATDELEVRKELAYHNKPVGQPIFVALEELAGLIVEAPEVAQYIGLLLRQSLKYGIVLGLAAQDLLAKTIGLDSGMIENILSGYYGGGDLRTAKIALDLQNGEHELIDENGLGQGVVYFRTPGLRATRVRIPWPDNHAVAQLCALSKLPVHELVRTQLDESLLSERAYIPEIGEEEAEEQRVEHGVSNIRQFPAVAETKVGKKPNPIQREHLVYVLENLHVSDANLKNVLVVTQHYANKIKRVVAFALQFPDTSDAEMAEKMSILEEDALLVKSLIRDAQKGETVNE